MKRDSIIIYVYNNMMKNLQHNLLFYTFITFCVLLLLYTMSLISNFFGVTFQYYGVYMFFGAAVLFLYLVLPSKPQNIFA